MNPFRTVALLARAILAGMLMFLAGGALAVGPTGTDLQVVVTVASDSGVGFVFGTEVVYTITATNAGPVTTNATVTDVFPASLASLGGAFDWSCTTTSGFVCSAVSGVGNIAVELVNMPPGGKATLTAALKIAAYEPTISNTASITGNIPDTNNANNSSTSTFSEILGTDLVMAVTDGVTTAVPGGSVTYTVTATNAGTFSVTGATVTDNFPASLSATWTCVGVNATCSAAGSGNIDDTVDLGGGGSVTYTVTAAISPGAVGSLSNTATIAGPAGVPDQRLTNNHATDTDTLSPSADLAITVTDGAAAVTAGGLATYTITASNAGPSDSGATVTDTLPASLTATWTCVGAGGGTCAASGSGNISDLVSLPAGGSVTYTVGAAVGAAAIGTLSNTATIAPSGGVTDPTPGNNSATDSDNVLVAAAAKADFNADGHSDVLWENSDGSAAVWLMNGLVSNGDAGILGPGSGFTVALMADFDGDGKTDLLWSHPDGRAIMWTMNGTAATAKVHLLPPGTGWHATHAGDFDGDGNRDIVWQNSDGSVAIWLMNGAGMISGSTILGPGTGWTVTQVADFDGDGRADLLWTNTDGRVAIWLMNGLAVASEAEILPAGTGWSVSRVADLDGDGKADIVWQNADGSVALWLMNGLAMTSSASILGAGTGWSVVATADFDGDGKADLYWQNTDGSAAIWLMDGLTPTTQAHILGAGSGWSLKRTADLDGNGMADILWQNTDGSVAAWLMNGAAMAAGSSILGPGTGWSVSGAGP